MASENEGYAQLAKVLQNRVASAIVDSDANMAIDFGAIQADGSLTTNSLPTPIPSGSYLICGNLLSVSCGGGTSTIQGHSHSVSVDTPQRIKRGTRVLVVWVGNDPVVIDVIHPASEVV
ncbi:hypothetical protein [Eubacterium sp.]|uniref:hypothetical protein n=1 Tax=Eubacterium sp. TaxID=142586 RepID=UPI0030DC597E